MIRRTIWKPDTCDSIIEFEWDDAEPVETRQHVPVRVIKESKLYEGMSLQDHFAAAVEDNVRKNKVEAILAEIVPEISETVKDSEQRDVKQLKKPLEHKYLPDRTLEVKLPDTVQGKKTIEAEILSRLQEVGKVVVI